MAGIEKGSVGTHKKGTAARDDPAAAKVFHTSLVETMVALLGSVLKLVGSALTLVGSVFSGATAAGGDETPAVA